MKKADLTTALSENLEANITAILELKCKKHVKIYKLSLLGLPKSQIASALTTNAGHVYNVLKDYNENPAKVEKAKLF